MVTADGSCGGLVAAGGDIGPTVDTFGGDFIGDRVGLVTGSGTDCRGAGVILAGLVRPVRAEEVGFKPVVNGSGRNLRGGMLDVGDVRPGRGVRLLIAGSGLVGLPI